jgi:FkbM family methyltransferase
MLETLKHQIRDFLHQCGYDIRRLDRSGWNSRHLRMLKFNPKTVFDVGACCGTKPLYEAFPDAHHVLIEPLAECETKLRGFLKRYRGELVPLAAGSSKGQRTIYVAPDESLYLSSFYQKNGATDHKLPVRKRNVPLTTLDAIVAERNLNVPFGLKIDVEGNELEVLKGASRTLQDTEFIILELSIQKRFDELFSCADIVSFLNQNGFRLHDILEIFRTINSEVQYVDAVFNRKER